MAGHKKSAYDIEEIKPGQFIVHNENAYSVLRGEGERRGNLFVLTTWRREGLLARIAARQYKALTLEARLEGLPELPSPLLPGARGLRPLGNPNERYSIFDGWRRTWQPLETVTHEGSAAVELREYQIVRRRKGRAAAEYARAIAERSGQMGIQPLDETAALLVGLAQSVALGTPPLAAQHSGDSLLLPALPLPLPYREFLRRVSEELADGWRVEERGWPFVERAFERLGIEIDVTQ